MFCLIRCIVGAASLINFQFIVRMLNSNLLGAQNEPCPTCVARLCGEMCGMILIGFGCGGMEVCSLVVRWSVCKFGSMVVRLLGCLLWLLLGFVLVRLLSSVLACLLREDPV